MSAYVRETASNFRTLNYEWRVLDEHLKVLYSLRNAVNALFLSIRRKDNYAPADLEYILERINDIYRSEKLLIQQIPRIKEEKARQVAIEARKIVRKYISSTEK